MDQKDMQLNAKCNFGRYPMPPGCYVEYAAPQECNTGFSPMPSYCNVVQLPPPVQTVPEPATLSMFGVGLVVMAIMLRRRV